MNGLHVCFALLFTVVAIECRQKTTPVAPASPIVYDFTKVDQLLAQTVTTVYAGGVVCLVEKDGKLIYRAQPGDLTATTPALIASATKTVSAAVLLSLIDEGKLALTDSVGKYLPIFTQNKKGAVTLRQLFAHTSGLADADDLIGSSQLTLAQAVDQIARTTPLLSKPGTAFFYGGTSMHVAGRMAEVATGQSWNSLFQERIAGPCGLKNTTFCLTPGNPRIAGGLCSTPDDILSFARMLLNNGMANGKRVLSAGAIGAYWVDQTMKAPVRYSPYPVQPPVNNPYRTDTIRYGFGDWLDVVNPQTGQTEQISGIGAFGTDFWIDRKRGLAGVIFTSSSFAKTAATTFQTIDLVRAEVDRAAR